MRDRNLVAHKNMVTRCGLKLTTHAHPAYELMRVGNLEPEETRIFHKIWAGYSPLFKQPVAVNPLDNILVGRFPQARLRRKIDDEGAEYGVLKGALATLARLPRPVWLIEIYLQEYHPSGISPDYADIFDLFRRHGYGCYAADEKRTAVAPVAIQRWLETGVREVPTFNYVYIDSSLNLQTVVGAAECIQ